VKPHQLKIRSLLATTVIPIFVALCWLSFSRGMELQRNTTDNPTIARGKYLVEEVAKCPECHTPRDAGGNLEGQAWLQGAPIWITPVRPIKNWADNAPPLAGLPSFRDEQVFRVLEKGEGPEGEVLRPPMHIYHMHHEDAQAIVAYLKSLPVKVH
jgi:mono/diheme cytochrome c family protein